MDSHYIHIPLHKVAVDQIDVYLLNWDAETGVVEGYQRVRLDARSKEIASAFNARLFEPPTLSLRSDGSYACIDGQARYNAAKAMGVTHVDCRVLTGLSPADEAQLFIDLQEKRQPISASDRFNALAGIKDSWADVAGHIFAEHGLFLGGKKNCPEGLSTITASAVVANLQKRLTNPKTNFNGAKFDYVLSESLSILAQGFPSERPFSSASIFGMTSHVAKVHERLPERRYDFIQSLKSGSYLQLDSGSFDCLNTWVKDHAASSSKHGPMFSEAFDYAWNTI